MRIDSWAGLVTDAGQFSPEIPPGGAATLINLRPKVGVLESRPGMGRIGFSNRAGAVDLLDCCVVTRDGKPVVLALDSKGNLRALRSPNYATSTSLLPLSSPCAAAGERLIDYTQRMAGDSDTEALEPCLPGGTPPPDAVSGFFLDGGTASAEYYKYVVDAMSACQTLWAVDGGGAAYDGSTDVSEEDLCGSREPPPPPPGLPPSVPLALAATFAPESAALSWQPPASDGGQPVSGYSVQISLDGQAWYAQPGPPSDLTVSFGNQFAALSWSAPDDTGDAAISGYEITAEASTNGGSTWTPVSL